MDITLKHVLFSTVGFGSVIIFFMALPYVVSVWKLLAKKSSFSKMGSSSKIRLIHQLNEAVTELAATKTGAIITITNKDGLDSHRTDGVVIDANISSQLIISLFNKESPLHDGAIIIQDSKITYASTFYKITSKSIDNKYGARHRAAMGICEITDSLTIIVSEETRGITFAKNSEFTKVAIADFQEKLAYFLKG